MRTKKWSKITDLKIFLNTELQQQNLTLVRIIETMISKQRAFIIASSLKIEHNLSILLGNLLYVNDINTSKTLGNKSSALSFNQKADLLLDTEFISPDDRKKFKLFMEIRNQFAHNSSCESYEDCLNLIDGCQNRLNKYYPLKNTEAESNTKKQVSNMIDDLNSMIERCQKKHIENLSEFLNAEYYSRAYKELKKSMIQNLVRIDQFIDFPVEPQQIKSLKDNLLKTIADDSFQLLTPKLEELEAKIEKRKLKKLE